MTNYRRRYTSYVVMFCLAVLVGMLSGCSSDSGSSTESLRIYTVEGSTGSFTAVAADTTATRFQLILKNQYTTNDPVLYFTNRGAVDSGFDTLGNFISNVWPRIYGVVQPNAILKATVNNLPVTIVCTLDKPVLNTAADTLSFTITYLDGQKPDASQALNDIEITINNNVASGQSVWSHQLEADVATYEPVKNPDGTTVDNTYTFRIQKTIGNAIGVTCAPQRKSETILVKDYINSWQARFGSVSPNAVIYYQDSNGQWGGGGVQTVTLSNPVYDEKSGNVSFTAKVLYSPWGPIIKTGLTVQNPTIFIDGGAQVSYTLKNTTDKNLYVYSFKYLKPAAAQPVTLLAGRPMQLLLVPDESMRVYFSEIKLTNTIEQGKAPDPFNYSNDATAHYSFMEYKYEPSRKFYTVDLSYIDEFSFPLTLKFSDTTISTKEFQTDFEYGFTSLSTVMANLKKQTDYRWDALIWPAVVDTKWDSEKYPKNMQRVVGPNKVWPLSNDAPWVPKIYFDFTKSLPKDGYQLFGKYGTDAKYQNFNAWQWMIPTDNPGPSNSGYTKALQQSAVADTNGKFGFFTYPQEELSAQFTDVPENTTCTITVYPYDK